MSSENSTEIGGRVVACGFLPAMKAVEVQVAIASLCGEALFKAVTTKSKNKQEVGAAAIAALTSHLDSDVLMKAMKTTFEYVSIDGKRVTSIDEAFAGGRNKDLWLTFFFALRVNFRDFFSDGLLDSMLSGVSPAE